MRIIYASVAFFCGQVLLAGNFQGIGVLPGDVGSVALGLSRDGRVAVGSSLSADTADITESVLGPFTQADGTAIRWTNLNRIQSLGISGAATDANQGGDVIVGITELNAYRSQAPDEITGKVFGQANLFRWNSSSLSEYSVATASTFTDSQYHPTTRDRIFQDLVFPEFGAFTETTHFVGRPAINATGSAVAFTGMLPPSPAIEFFDEERISYTTNLSGPASHVGLGHISDISESGGVVVGTQTSARPIPGLVTDRTPRAYRVDSSQQQTILSNQRSFAQGVSADGQYTVGSVEGEAIKWNGNTPISLGHPSTFSSSEAFATSRQGQTTVGLFSNASGSDARPAPDIPTPAQTTAAIWDKHLRRASLADYLVQENYIPSTDIAGWTLTDATAISDDGFVIAGNGINPSGQREGWVAVLRKHVVLNFGQSVPGNWDPRIEKDANGNQVTNHYYDSTLSDRAAEQFAFQDQQSIIGLVQDIFSRSGIESVHVTTEPSPNAVNVFFGQPIQGSGLAGESISIYESRITGVKYPGINRFASDHTGDVAVLLDATHQLGLKFIAETVAHEVGHALGLFHVNPDGPGSVPVLDYDFSPSLLEEFSDIPSRALANPDDLSTAQSFTHNPRYHLEVFVDKTPPSRTTLSPGDWDIQQPVTLQFGNTRINLREDPTFMLHDVVLTADSGSSRGPGGHVVLRADEIQLQDLEETLADLTVGFRWLLSASSTEGSDADIFLYSGAPDDIANAGVFASALQPASFSLLLFDGNGGSIALADGVLAVPEPSSLLLIGLVSVSVLTFGRSDRKDALS